MTVVARFEIESIRFIGNDGMPMAELPAFARDRGTLAMLYRAMVLTRTFDAKAVALRSALYCIRRDHLAELFY